MSIASPTVSLRDIAAQAWERQQAEATERRRQEAEAARARFISEARRSLRALASSAYDPFSPFTEADIEAAEVEVLFTADGTPFEASLSFAGERFRYHPTPNCGGSALWHVYACPVCRSEQESSQPIDSLADLGYWLELAPQWCSHGDRS